MEMKTIHLTTKSKKGVWVTFPGGEVYVTSCGDGSFWAHICLDRDATDEPKATVLDARIDYVQPLKKGSFPEQLKNQGEEALRSPEFYHVAARITSKEE